MLKIRSMMVAAAVAASAGAASAQTYSESFGDANLGGPRLYGDAVVDNGSLRLTPNDYGRSGAMVIGGGDVSGFTATFDFFFDNNLGGFTADGVSFTLGRFPDGPVPGGAEKGTGSGITVSLDIFDFNEDGFVGDYGIRVLYNGQVVAEAPDSITDGDRGQFRPLLIRLHDENQLDVQFNGNGVFTNLVISDFQPDPSYRFGIAGRTGGERAEQRVDNLVIDADGINGTDCAHTQAIFGDGVYWFNNSNAGTDGVGNALCDASGSDQIENDVWYCWTATETGVATVSTVGLSNIDQDTKIAVYQDCVPCTEARGIIACNDDSVGLQSTVSFPATAGTRYLIRVGNYPGSNPGRCAVSFSTAADCNADFNGDHVVNSQDFFDFLNAFFTGC